VATQGVWDVVQYALSTLSKAMSGGAGTAGSTGSWGACPGGESVQQKMENSTFVFGSILRTVKLIGSDSVSRNGFETTSSRFIIESLPPEERQRAAQLMEGIPSGNMQNIQ